MSEQDTTTSSVDTVNEPVGIGGWLIIPAIGLILGPIKATVGFFMGIHVIRSFAPELTSNPWLWFSGAIDILMIVACVIVAILFFQYRRIAVIAIISLMICSIIANLIQTFINASLFEADFDIIELYVVSKNGTKTAHF